MKALESYFDDLLAEPTVKPESPVAESAEPETHLLNDADAHALMDAMAEAALSHENLETRRALEGAPSENATPEAAVPAEPAEALVDGVAHAEAEAVELDFDAHESEEAPSDVQPTPVEDTEAEVLTEPTESEPEAATAEEPAEDSGDFMSSLSEFIDEANETLEIEESVGESEFVIDPATVGTVVVNSAAQETIKEPEPEPEPAPELQFDPHAESPFAQWDPSRNQSAMLLEVQGISFAIPKACVAQVLYKGRVEDHFDEAQPWRWGVVASDEGWSLAVDTAQVFVGAKYHAEMRKAYRKAIVIQGLGLALGADAIVDEVEIPADGVTWRQDRETRPWLMGTWAEHRCALVDPAALVRMLAELENE